MEISDVVLITEQGIDVLLDGVYSPARSLQNPMRTAVARDPSIAEYYYAALMTSAATLADTFAVSRVPTDDPDELERQTRSLYRRRLLFSEGFQQDLYGLNSTLTMLEDDLIARIRISSMNDSRVPKTAPFHLVLAAKPDNLVAEQPLTMFTLLKIGEPAKLQPVAEQTYGSLHSKLEAQQGDALYAVREFPRILRSNPRAERSALLHTYIALKRSMIEQRMEFYPWLSYDNAAN